MAILLSLLLFLALTASIAWFGYRHYVQPSILLDQLRTGAAHSLLQDSMQASEHAPWNVVRILQALGNVLPIPAKDIERSQAQLFAAGFRDPCAVGLYHGIKLALAVSGTLCALLLRGFVPDPLLRTLLPFGAAAGLWSAASFVLGAIVRRRQEGIRFALADVLDLLVICSEAGCGLDQAMLNVSRDLRSLHPVMAEELTLLNMEVMAGSSRADALRSLAKRCQDDEVRKLTAVLIQTDRFGTSVAEALRTQSEFLRARRRQEAEERAGKVGVKLVFPIFFFCLPALLIVTAGPAVLQLFTNFFPMLRQSGH